VSAQTALERGRKDGHNSRSGVFIYIYIYIHTHIYFYASQVITNYLHDFEDGKNCFLK
jgi:hypothetical protein